jgi:hypothetical protein
MGKLTQVLEKRNRDQEQQELDAEAEAYALRQRTPAVCHGFKCPNAGWVHDVAHCHSLKLSSRPALVKTLTDCPESCWDSEPEQPGCLGESIVEAKRVLHESSRAVLELEAKVWNANSAQQNLALLEMNMRGKFELLLTDCRSKKGDPSKRLDQSIWREGGERVRQETQPYIDKLDAQLRSERRKRDGAIELLVWLKAQR